MPFLAATAHARASRGGPPFCRVHRHRVHGRRRDGGLVRRQSATEHAKEAAGLHASFIAKTILRDTLKPSDFAQPVSAARRAELDRLFRREILVEGALRAKLYGPDGTVTYATEHELIGDEDLEEDLAEALGGVQATEVGSLNGEGGIGTDQKALEAYVPMSFFDGQYPRGAFELYQSYAPVAAAARAEYVPVAIVLGLGLLALYLSLFPVLRRVTRRLEEHVDEIRHQSLHDSLTGLPNRDAVRRPSPAGDLARASRSRIAPRCC